MVAFISLFELDSQNFGSLQLLLAKIERDLTSAMSLIWALFVALICVNLQVQSNQIIYPIDTIAVGVGSIYSVTVDPRSNEQYISGWNIFGIKSVTTSGIVSMFAGTGSYGRTDGTGNAASFSSQVYQTSYCAYDGNFYLVDSGNFILRQMTNKAIVKTIAGGSVQGSANGVGTNALFRFPIGVACNRDTGDIMVVDHYDSVLRLVSRPVWTVTLFAGRLSSSGYQDGPGTYAQFYYPYHIAFNSVNKNFYVADTSNQIVRQVTLLGIVSTFAGRPLVSGFNDGMGTFALFNYPFGVDCDEISGNVFVADTHNNRVREIDLTTRMVSARTSSGQVI